MRIVHARTSRRRRCMTNPARTLFRERDCFVMLLHLYSKCLIRTREWGASAKVDSIDLRIGQNHPDWFVQGTNRSVNQALNQRIRQSSNQNQSIGGLISQSTIQSNQPTSLSKTKTNHSIANQSIIQSFNHSSNQPTNQPANQPTYRPINANPPPPV